MKFTIGGHNLHDDAGVPTFFADVIMFTEAIAPTIKDKARQKVAHAKARLAGYSIVVCHEQPDLVIAYRRRLFKYTGRSYTKYVDGWAKVTPNRGTFVVFVEGRSGGGQPYAFVGEHRINAAFPPYVRSSGDPAETKFRIAAWRRHTAGTLDTLNRLEASGYHVEAAGDLNVPTDVSGYQGRLHELGIGRIHFDRLGSSDQVGGFEILTREKSDHNRIRATVDSFEK